MTGRLGFGVVELELICDTLGIDLDYVMTGIRAVSTDPPHPFSGRPSPLPTATAPRTGSPHPTDTPAGTQKSAPASDRGAVAASAQKRQKTRLPRVDSNHQPSG